MTRRPVLHLACILLLLFAQQAALTHASWHAGHGGAAHAAGHDEPGQAALCSLHSVFAEVLGALPGACPPNAAVVPAPTELPATSATHAGCLLLHLPPARGPPLRS